MLPKQIGGEACCPQRAASIRSCPTRAGLEDLPRRAEDSTPYLHPPARGATATASRPQGLASTSATLPSKSVVRTCVELRGTTVFMTPVPSLCSHLRAPVLAPRAKSKSFLVP